MMQRNNWLVALAFSLAAIAWCGPTVLADEFPDGENEPVDVSAKQNPNAAGAVSGAYHSDSLQADFIAEWMSIKQSGAVVTFWGARITKLHPKSPLKELNLNTGDVITRLDGPKISRDMKQGKKGWTIPELDRHVGTTEIRYIFSGTSRVRNGEVELEDNANNGGGTPIAP